MLLVGTLLFPSRVLVFVSDALEQNRVFLFSFIWSSVLFLGRPVQLKEDDLRS